MSFKSPAVQALLVTNVLSNVIRLLSNLVIARILSPEAFAITGLAATIMFVFNMVSDVGFRAFILRRSDGEELYFLKTLWTIKFVRSVLLAIMIFGCSATVAGFFEIPELNLVLKFLSLNFLIEALKPFSDLLAERKNKVAQVLYIQFSSYLISTIFIVVAVYFHHTYWVIVYGMVLNTILVAVLNAFFLGVNGSGFAFDRLLFKEFMSWAKFIIPSSIITLLLMQFDKVVLSRTLTVEQLGLYYVAFNFSSAALTLVVQYARKVMEPYMARVYRESVARYKDVYYGFKTKMSSLIALMLGGLSGCSYLFFHLLYDDRYIYASVFLSVLLMTPILALLTYTSEFSLILHGKIKMTLVANLLRLAWFVGAAPLAYYLWGVLGMLVTIGMIELFPAGYMMYQMHRIGILVLWKEVMILLVALVGFSFGSLLTMLFKNSGLLI